MRGVTKSDSITHPRLVDSFLDTVFIKDFSLFPPPLSLLLSTMVTSGSHYFLSFVFWVSKSSVGVLYTFLLFIW